MKWIYLPPLLIYSSAGVSGLTNIVGIFFLKDYLNLSAAFIASIGFWAGIPWALKMPVGFLVDKFWGYKNYLVYVGAIVIFISLFIMYLLLINRPYMEIYLPSETWFIISTILTPVGYVIQDVVADAMTVEAVETNSDVNNDKVLIKDNLDSQQIKKEHTLVQMYGRFAIIFGSLIVSLVNILMFKGIDKEDKDMVINVYADIYLISLVIPFLSITGVIISSILRKGKRTNKKYKQFNSLDHKIFLGSIVFVFTAIILGGFKIPFSQEIILFISLLLISILMFFLTQTLEKKQRYSIVGTAIIIFIYRSLPSPGPGISWFEIDVLRFDQSFLSVLSFSAALITLLGIILFKNVMIKSSIPKLFLFLSIISAFLYIPSLLMYYGVHEYTSVITKGIVDARFIALINTAVESPISQIAMIPLLAWIARNAPMRYKATFFAVFASFTNLALSTKELATKYLNQIFIVKREVRDLETEKIIETADYSSLDGLLMSVIFIAFIIPIITIYTVQKSKFKSLD